jgi:hypothetical protein
VRQAINGKTKVIRTTGARWSQAAERVFLEELAATCNVTAASAAAGFSTTAIYKRRMRWPGFAEAWDEALEQGYVRIETMLVEAATDSLSRQPIAGDREAPAMSVDQAMNLLRLHRASVRGGAAQRYDARAKAADVEAVRASILRKIEAIERADARRAGSGGGASS